MSIMLPFERLFETAAASQKREGEKIAAQRREQNGDDADPPTFRCRVCDLEAASRAYCPDCLADTMVAIPSQRDR